MVSFRKKALKSAIHTKREPTMHEQQVQLVPPLQPGAFERCPIEETMTLLGGKWKMTLIWWLMSSDRRFSELRRCVPTVTQKMLTQQLRELELHGFVRREVFAQVPPKVVYSLTPHGRSLEPVLATLIVWARDQKAHIPQVHG